MYIYTFIHTERIQTHLVFIIAPSATTSSWRLGCGTRTRAAGKAREKVFSMSILLIHVGK
jgi:hypothetical protein